MANPHSTVKYVEPNYTFDGLTNASSDRNRYDRAPDLEDYCIALDIEVELSSRDKTADISNSENRCIVMSYRSDNNGESKVRFLSGSRIGGHHRTDDGKYEPNLKGQYNAMTTVYADMYTYDLTDYGTTELLGIKSVDVEYNSSFVPVITIKFTDVRGMSLMQPSELSHLSLNGINGVPADNLAQSFFQSFFTLPFPLFRVHLKGFYGNPVSYQVMCDKFETSFNSQTGDFDVTTRFVGFAYSFMADISFNVLMAAPYSDYGGSDYWNSKNFKIKNTQGQLVVDMPKLFDLRTTFKEVVSGPDSTDMPTSEQVEIDNHDEEILQLNQIKDMCTAWYNSVADTINDKDLVYKLGKNENECSCLVVMSNGKDVDAFNKKLMGNEDFRNINKNLHSAIENFNNSSNENKKLKNVKKLDGENPDLYKPSEVFNGYVFVSDPTAKVTDQNTLVNTSDGASVGCESIRPNGFSNRCKIPEEYLDSFKRQMYNGWNNSRANKLYPSPENQYRYAYVIDLGTDDIYDRIQRLINDRASGNENGNVVSQSAEERWYEALTWYPTIENFTRIVMAHVETLMHIFYKVQKETKGRTIEQLGISIDKLVDLPKNSKLVGPFPRVTEYVTETGAGEVVYGGLSYGMTRKEDVWIGDYSKGNGIREVDMVNGILNGISYMQNQLKKETEQDESENNGEEEVRQPITVLLAPLTTYDFFIKKNPYGSNGNETGNSNISNIPEFAGKVFIRMMGILGFNGFAILNYITGYQPTTPQGSGSIEDILTGFNGIGSSVLGDLAESLGKIEAYNFAKFNTISGDVERALGENGTLTSENIIKLCTTNKLDDNEVNVPWGKRTLSDDGNELWINGYKVDGSNGGFVTIQPIQDISFSNLSSLNDSINSTKSFEQNEDVCYIGDSDTLYSDFTTLLDKTYYTSIITEDYDQINKILDQAKNGSIEDYKKYANLMGKTINQIYGNRQLLSRSKRDNSEEIEAARRMVKKYTGQEGYGTVPPISSGVETSSIALIPSGYDFPQRDKPVLHDNGEVGFNDPLYVTSSDGSNITIETNLSEHNKDFIEESYNRNINSFTISEVFSSYSNSLLLTPDFYNTETIEDFILGDDYRYSMAIRFLFGIDGFNYDSISDNFDNICSYMPKFVMLQICAYVAIRALNESGTKHRDMGNYDGPANKSLFKILEKKTFAPSREGVYIQYFRDWVDKNYNKLDDLCVNNDALIRGDGGKGRIVDISISKIVNSNYTAIFSETKGIDLFKSTKEKDLISNKSIYRLLLNPKAQAVKWLSNELLSTVCFMRLSVADEKRNDIINKYSVQRGVAINYLDGFLKELGRIKGGDVDTTGMQLAMVPEKTTDSMKIEIYRQLKVVYDKWVCSTKESDWDHLKFFEEGENYDNPVGNSFFFIDSFYNKMNHALMNPDIIAKKVDLSLTTVDVRVMLANFLSEVYGMHNFMMKCVNNFRMLTKYMDDLFLTHPFNRMPPEKVLPDFVLIYAYEASKYADIPNGEYANDGFMLNDEDDTPLPITSRSDEKTYFKIPAFGVSYGRQYQHFFKAVNVDMNQPAATEQATVSKYAILANSRGETYRGVSAQDAFDIYSNQSYTCKLEMMGCAYIQPLMYFVLLNVPFFRGSYLISRVSHHIVPGDMSTTVTGVRMSKYCNHLVRKMLSNQDYYGGGSGGGGGKPYIEPNAYNNCSYALFPVGNATGGFNGDPVPKGPGGKFSEPKKEPGQRDFCIALFHAYISAGVNPTLAKILVMQDALESGYGSNNASLYYNYGGIKPSTEYVKFNSIPEYVSYKLKKSLDKNWPEWRNQTTLEGYVGVINNDSKKTRYSGVSYQQYLNEIGGCKKRVLSGLTGVAEVSDMTNQQKEEYNDNFGKYFVEAVLKSYESLPSSSKSNLKVEQKDNHILFAGSKDLSKIFDIILNGYYKFVELLYWMYSKAPTDPEPIGVEVFVNPNNELTAKRHIYITKKSKEDANSRYNCSDFTAESAPVSQSFVRSIAKCYTNKQSVFAKECTQFNGCKSIFANYNPTMCSLLEENATNKTNNKRSGRRSGGSASNCTGAQANRRTVVDSAKKKIGCWNLEAAITWLNREAEICKTVPCGSGKCAEYVENAIAGCHKGDRSTTGLRRVYTTEYNNTKYASNLRYGNLLPNLGFNIVVEEGYCTPDDRTSHATLMPGDVAVVGYDANETKGTTKFHACMWNGVEWVSDYFQCQNMSPYGNKKYYPGGKMPFIIYRFNPNTKSKT